jgi:hypothetical protein
LKKTCIIGDSSVAVLRTATSSEYIRQHHDLTFFYSHYSYISKLVLQDSKLISLSGELTEALKQCSGGLDYIDISSYDDFIISGLGLWIMEIAVLYQRYASDSMPGPGDGRYLLSDECFLALAEEAVCGSGAVGLARSIRSVCDKPITVLSHPNPGLGMPDEWLAAEFTLCHQVVSNGDDHALAAFYREACARVAKKCNVTIISPISEAAANGVFNLHEYCQLPAVIGDELDADDIKNRMVHGNDLYGRTILPYILVPSDTEIDV